MLFLVKNGVPYDVAMRLSPTRRVAYVVAIGELAGGAFDWRTMSWKDRR